MCCSSVQRVVCPAVAMTPTDVVMHAFFSATDQGHMKAESPILCSPNPSSNPNLKINIWDVDIKPKFFLEIMIEYWKTWFHCTKSRPKPNYHYILIYNFIIVEIKSIFLKRIHHNYVLFLQHYNNFWEQKLEKTSLKIGRDFFKNFFLLHFFFVFFCFSFRLLLFLLGSLYFF